MAEKHQSPPTDRKGLAMTTENTLIERLRPLRWYKSTDHPQDRGQLTAHGWGGRYSIEPDLNKFIVWMAHDEFTFKTGATIDECKTIAEQHYRETAATLFKTDKETGEANCWVPPAREAQLAPATSEELVERVARALSVALDGGGDPGRETRASKLKRWQLAGDLARAAIAAMPAPSAMAAVVGALEAVLAAREAWINSTTEAGDLLASEAMEAAHDNARAALALVREGVK